MKTGIDTIPWFRPVGRICNIFSNSEDADEAQMSLIRSGLDVGDRILLICGNRMSECDNLKDLFDSNLGLEFAIASGQLVVARLDTVMAQGFFEYLKSEFSESGVADAPRIRIVGFLQSFPGIGANDWNEVWNKASSVWRRGCVMMVSVAVWELSAETTKKFIEGCDVLLYRRRGEWHAKGPAISQESSEKPIQAESGEKLKPEKMVSVCAWCGKLKADGSKWVDIGPREIPQDQYLTTHGMCEDCYETIAADLDHITGRIAV